MRARRPQSASRKVSYQIAGSGRRPLPDRDMEASNAVPEASQSYSGPGVVRDFPPDSKYTWDQQENDQAFSLGAGPTGRSNSGTGFRTVDISRMNEKRHNWTKVDTFQTPVGHVGDMEDIPDAPSACNFHSKWLGVLYKEIMNGMSRLLTAELVEMREDLHREFDAVKEHAAEVERTTCDFVDKVVSGRAKELKYDLEGVGNRMDAGVTESATKMLDCVNDLSREALRHHSQVDSTLQHLRSSSNDMGLSLAKELGGVVRSIESGKDETRVLLQEAISGLPNAGTRPPSRGGGMSPPPAQASQPAEVEATLPPQLVQDIASMQKSMAESMSILRSLQTTESKLSDLTQECRHIKSGVSDGIERVVNAVNSNGKASGEMLSMLTRNSQDVSSLRTAVDASASALQQLERVSMPQLLQEVSALKAAAPPRIDLEPVAQSVKEGNQEVLAKVADLSSQLQRRKSQEVLEGGAQAELLSIARNIREDMKFPEVQASLADISALLRDNQSSAAANSPPQQDPKQAELLGLVREVHENYMKLSEIQSNLMELNTQIQQAGVLGKSETDEVKLCIIEESKVIQDTLQEQLQTSVQAIQSSRHDLDPLWVTIRSSTEQIGVVLADKFGGLHQKMDQDREQVQTTVQEVKRDLLAAAGAGQLRPTTSPKTSPRR